MRMTCSPCPSCQSALARTPCDVSRHACGGSCSQRKLGMTSRDSCFNLRQVACQVSQAAATNPSKASIKPNSPVQVMVASRVTSCCRICRRRWLRLSTIPAAISTKRASVYRSVNCSGSKSCHVSGIRVSNSPSGITAGSVGERPSSITHFPMIVSCIGE